MSKSNKNARLSLHEELLAVEDQILRQEELFLESKLTDPLFGDP